MCTRHGCAWARPAALSGCAWCAIGKRGARAWRKTCDCADSMTPSVVSLPRSAGRQWRKMVSALPVAAMSASLTWRGIGTMGYGGVARQVGREVGSLLVPLGWCHALRSGGAIRPVPLGLSAHPPASLCSHRPSA